MTDEPFDYVPDTAATAWSTVAAVTGLIAIATLITAVVIV